jgi:DNA-binding MarR family transcriptional regulator
VLERKGHVVRNTSAQDGRAKTIAMTDSAREVCYSRAFCDAGDKLVEDMFAGFSPQERQTFTKLLGRVRKNLEQIAD